MRPNKMKQMWKDGRCVTMGWLSVSHGFTAEVMARNYVQVYRRLLSGAAQPILLNRTRHPAGPALAEGYDIGGQTT